MSQDQFQFVALPSSRFQSLFDMSDAALAELGARRMTVDANPGFPCRVSLVDAEAGETVLLLPFLHHDVASPYRASGPIFVRQAAATAAPAPDEVPVMLRHRLLSVRAYDLDAMMIGAEVVEGAGIEDTIRRFLSDDHAAYLHVHNARPGCYNCRVERARLQPNRPISHQTSEARPAVGPAIASARQRTCPGSRFRPSTSST